VHFVALGYLFSVASRPVAIDGRDGLLSRPEGRQISLPPLGRDLERRQRAQIKILPGLEKRARLQRRHLAIPYVQQPVLSQAGRHLPDGGDIQGIIGVVPGHDRRRQGQPQRIQRRHHHLHLGQIRAMIFAMAKLEYTLGHHSPRATRSGTVQPYTCRPQGIHPHQLLGQGALKGAPVGIVTQRLQHEGQPVIADVQRMEGVAGASTQRVEPFLRPWLHVIQPMIRLREDMGQPEHRHPTQAEPLPVTMGGKVRVQQRLYPHPRHLSQQQGNIVHAFTEDGQGLVHTETLSQCAKPLQI